MPRSVHFGDVSPSCDSSVPSSQTLRTRLDSRMSRLSRQSSRPLGRAILIFYEQEQRWLTVDADEEEGEIQGDIGDDGEEVEEEEEIYRIGSKTRQEPWRLYSLLALAAVVTSLLAFVNDVAISEGHHLRRLVIDRINEITTASLGKCWAEVVVFIAWIVWQVAFVGIAHFCVSLQPVASGSGIPEIRCELQNTHLRNFFTRGVFCAKLSGLVFSEIAGLPVGKEGPFVHMSAIISLGLLRLRFFRKVRCIPGFTRQILMASSAVATAATFGVPIGSALFALEIMPDCVFESTSYWGCLLSAVMGSLVLRVLTRLWPKPVVNLLPRVSGLHNDDYGFFFFVLATGLGVVCGVLGAGFVRWQLALQARLNSWISNTPMKRSVSTRLAGNVRHGSMEEPLTGVWWRHRTVSQWNVRASRAWHFRSLLLCLGVAFLNSVPSFLVPLLRDNNDYQLLWKLVSAEEIDWAASTKPPPMPTDSYLVNLREWKGSLLFCVLLAKASLMSLTLCLPLPAGCIMPLYVVGALLGRSLNMATMALPFMSLVPVTGKAGYHAELALIGATALAAAVCRSFSVVVAVLELTGLPGPNLTLPLCCSAIAAIYVSGWLAPSIFEGLLKAKGLPAVPQPRNILDAAEPIETLAQTDALPILPEICEGESGRTFLQRQLSAHAEAARFGVVSGGLSGMDTAPLLGVVPREIVEEAVALAANSERTALCTKDQLQVVPQVPGWMPVKHAFHVLELFSSSLLFVTRAGRPCGVATFDTLVRARRERLLT